jgi:hypothetical protein
MDLEGVVHALEKIHHSLRAEGVMLDIHPQPENTRVEVWQEGRIESLGPIDDKEDIRDIRQARARLSVVERRGRFITERRRTFDLLEHYPTVEDWLERRASEGGTSTIPEGMLDSARHLLTAGSGELIKREPIRASLLRRLPAAESALGAWS